MHEPADADIAINHHLTFLLHIFVLNLWIYQCVGLGVFCTQSIMACRVDGDGAPPAHNDRFKLKDFKEDKGDSAASWLRQCSNITTWQNWND